VQEVLTGERELRDYSSLVSEETLSEIEGLADRLKGLRVIHVNATPQGGGVAEILNSLIPLLRGAGIDAKWYVIPPDESFATITKSLHHSLQGNPGCLTGEQMKAYLTHNQRAALELKSKSISADVWVIHDPQALPLVNFLPDTGRAVWNCHIDTTEPNRSVQDSLMPFVNRYQKVIFTRGQYMLEGLSQDKICIFAPAIDPLSSKNLSLPRAAARQTLAELGVDPTRPLVSQVSRFDRWKDPWGVIDAYRMARENIPGLQLALVGVLAAQDDPDAQSVLRSVQRYAGNDPGIHIFSDPSTVDDWVVNAFQTASDVVVQKSIREGFGLTVAEAMWKGTPVVGGDCGGIRLQIRDGETSLLVSSPEECAARIITLLRNPDLARRIGRAGRESVKRHFLIPRLLRDHLSLYASLMAEEDRIVAKAPVRGEEEFVLAVSS
jgi:trehalose synthase